MGVIKVRFDGLDVMAMASHLNEVLLGRRVINIYEGDTNDAFIFKLDHQGGGSNDKQNNDSISFDNNNKNNINKKPLLYMQSGIRFHMSNNEIESSQHAHKTLAPFVMKLRKNLRGLRLENIQQLGNDRVVNFVFGSGDQRRAIILELYAKGNILLTDQKYQILSLLRSHQYEGNQVQVQVGHIYPVTYATNQQQPQPQPQPQPEQAQQSSSDASDSGNDNNNSNHKIEQIMAWADTQFQPQQQQQQQPQKPQQNDAKNNTNNNVNNKKKKNNSNKKQKKASSPLTLKTLLLKPFLAEFSKYGPSFLEHCILCAGFKPNIPLLVDTLPTKEDWETLRSVLKEQSNKILLRHDHSSHHAYILYSLKQKQETNDNDKLGDKIEDQKKEKNDDNNNDKILEEFQPHLLKQHEGRLFVKYDDFSQAVDTFFSQIEGQKRLARAQAAETAAKDKLEKVRLDQQQRVATLQHEQQLILKQAQVVEAHAEDIDKAITVVNSALDSGMDWEQLEELIHVEQEENNNPIANLIYELDLKQDNILLSLPDFITATEQQQAEEEDDNNNNEEEEDDDEKQKNQEEQSMIVVPISLTQTAYANASTLYEQYRASKEKSQKTIEASTKALKAAEETAKKQLVDAQKRKTQTMGAIAVRRKHHWFEKFHWFITSDNYLVVGGRDAHQNEQLVKRYLRPGDAYLHADVHGAASCILRAKRIRATTAGKNKNKSKASLSSSTTTTATQVVPMSDQALREAGNFTICRSSAWASKMVTSAWWVESHQVSKTAPTGEYLSVGAFMIRGKKNFLPPTQLEMGIGILFRLGDDSSIARHAKDRRDFALMELEQNQLEDKEEEEKELQEQFEKQRQKENEKENNNKKDTNQIVEEVQQQGQEQHQQEEDKEEEEQQQETNNDKDVLTATVVKDSDMVEETSDEQPEEVHKQGKDDNTNSLSVEIESNIKEKEDQKSSPKDNSAFDGCNNEQAYESGKSTNDGNGKDGDNEHDYGNENNNDGVNNNSSDNDITPATTTTTTRKKKGLSVRERKLVRKYGSLEAAEKALATEEQKQLQQKCNKTDKNNQSNRGNKQQQQQQQQQQSVKRGKKGKNKKAKKKYGDQDEEDRELAMLALQGGEKDKKKNGNNNNKRGGRGVGGDNNNYYYNGDDDNIISTTEVQKLVAAETAAILRKDAAKIAEKLPERVRTLLAECVTVLAAKKITTTTTKAKYASSSTTDIKHDDDNNNDGVDDNDKIVVRWDKFDADVLEQLIDLDVVGGDEAKIAAAKRLLYLKKSTRVDNFSASLAGILRTIRKYGYQNLEVQESVADAASEDTAVAAAGKRKTKEEKLVETSQWKGVLKEEGIIDTADGGGRDDVDDLDEDAIDDTFENNKLTGKPHPQDTLLYAIPVCAPYQVLSQYTFRVKLTPGNLKRGKAAKQCLDILVKGGGESAKSSSSAADGIQKDLIKKVGDNDWVQAICADVKIAAAGASKAVKKQKINYKKSKKR